VRSTGKFGPYGGFFVAEVLIPALEELEAAFEEFRDDPAFCAELADLLKDYAGRPTPLYHAKNLSRDVGFKVYLKREDLLHGGAHKTNNTLGQGLLARRMGKRRLIAETGAGQHGVATALVGALLEMDVTIFMGAKDVARQRPNVERMKLFGAKIHPVHQGEGTLKEAINETLRYWTEHVRDTFYVFGTAAGPHPYPTIVRHFQRIMGDEARAQIIEQEGRLPDAVLACVGGGSNAIGIFAPFMDDENVRLVGVEAAGFGLTSNQHGATLSKGRPGCLHGSISYLLQNDDGQIDEAHSISAGLDYPGVGPEHSYLKDIGRAEYVSTTDADAIEAVSWIARREGILSALETAHAVAHLKNMREEVGEDGIVLVNLSGRGDKDLNTILGALNQGDEAP
jgi:tryptophan synthase beta chain